MKPEFVAILRIRAVGMEDSAYVSSRPLRSFCTLSRGLPSRSSFTQDKARLRVALRRYGAASFAFRRLAWFTEPKLAVGERRMVDQTGIEPVTS